METRNSSTRSLTATRVATILSGCIIPAEGPNKLAVVGRGNPFTREDGTSVRIFNVQAFASIEDANQAAEHFKKGAAIEKAGDIDGAQEHYKNALNKMMNFSVLEQNAADFSSAYQILGKVEWVETRDGGKKLGLNQPRPVAVATSGANTSHLFSLPADEISTETTGKPAGDKPSLASLKNQAQGKSESTTA